MSKQDRQGVRTPADLERKYTFADISKTKRAGADTASQVVWLTAATEQYAQRTDAALAEVRAGLSSKVNTSDIVDNLTTENSRKPLSAKQGAVLRKMIDSVEGGGGIAGEDGVGIESVVQTTTSAVDGGTNIVTVTLTDGSTSTFQVKNGSKGSTGAAGADGYTPIKGVDYFDGNDGAAGEDGYTPVKGVDYFDGKDGMDGKNGANGKDGVSVTHSWSGTTLTVTSASGTSSADLKGEKGDKGDPGDGASVEIANDLVTNDATKVLSAAQGVALNALWSGCWISFTDENGNPTDEPYIHWLEQV